MLFCICVVHFKDFEIAKEILMERDPWHQKCLGKKVRNFDEIEWNKVSHLVVKTGSLEKVFFGVGKFYIVSQKKFLLLIIFSYIV